MTEHFRAETSFCWLLEVFLVVLSKERTSITQEFDRAAWLGADPRTRFAMVEELLRGNELLGKSRRDVIRQLGQPDGWTLRSPGGCHMRYRHGSGPASHELHVHLNDDGEVQGLEVVLASAGFAS